MKIGDTLLDPVEGWKGTVVKLLHQNGVIEVEDSVLASIAVVECSADGKLDWMKAGHRLIVDIRNCILEEEAGDLRRRVKGRDA